MNIPLWVEAIYGLAQALTFYRIYLQYSESKKENRSVNPYMFWIISIIINILVGLYGILIGSWIMPITILIAMPVSLWHLKLEKNRQGFS